MKARLQRLRAEVASDRAAFAARVEELAALDLEGTPRAGDLAQAAVSLHHGYGAVESLLGRIARTLGEGLFEGADGHQRLLEAMGLEIESVRPAVLSSPSLTLLMRLLGFRHFFRHAYAVTLDRERLARLRGEALELRPLLEKDLDRFDDFLRKLAEAAP